MEENQKHCFLAHHFSDEEISRDWTLSDKDKRMIRKHRKNIRLFIAVQLCAVRLFGRFLKEVNELSPSIFNYINHQLNLPPSLVIEEPKRKATYTEYRKTILRHLEFRTFDKTEEDKLKLWVKQMASDGSFPDELLPQAEKRLLAERVILPGHSILVRLINGVCAAVHDKIFASLYVKLPPEIKQAIDRLITVENNRRLSFFGELKEYPPSAKITSLKNYLKRYFLLAEIKINEINEQIVPSYQEYLFKIAKRSNASQIKRVKKHKRYALMFCFLIEAKKLLLSHLVDMHDQYLTDMKRETGHAHEKACRAFRKREKKAISKITVTMETLLSWPDEKPLYKKDIVTKKNEKKLQKCIQDLKTYKRLLDCGFGELLLKRYSSFRKYFANFVNLPFCVEQGSEDLLTAINTVRKLDAGEIKRLPKDVPFHFVIKELRKVLRDESGKIKRNAWELGLGFAIKEKFRSGDLYLPESKKHASFQSMILDGISWQKSQVEAYTELKQPPKPDAVQTLKMQFYKRVQDAQKMFKCDNFAEIINGKLKLKRDDKAEIPQAVTQLQKAIDASMPSIRIERLLIEVDKLTNFSRLFVPVPNRKSRPTHFYKALMSTIISQATNLGIVAMSASVNGVSIDMLRHVLQYYIREENLKAASAQIVNKHHSLPLSKIHGTGSLSSSDGQRFKICADSLLAAYYPRYYGYYDKAIGIYTHVSDQYSVFNTKVISCSPREALYVLDGLLENNTILKIRRHTTDTQGYTEIIFALCYLLGFYFMPRIKDLKHQQLYRIDKSYDYDIFTPLLNPSLRRKLKKSNKKLFFYFSSKLFFLNFR